VFEQRGGPLGGRQRGSRSQRGPLLYRQAGQGLPERGLVAEALAQRHRLFGGAERLPASIGVEQRPREGLGQRRLLLGRQQLAAAQRLLVQGRRLALRPGPDRSTCRRRCVGDHGRVVAGLDSVVDDPG
jgi:hypothetical protein